MTVICCAMHLQIYDSWLPTREYGRQVLINIYNIFIKIVQNYTKT